ncbi:hypothetical protein [Mesorhizobium sp. M0488]|uniref:hypothetical protein n=1 Tax=unclassified Mesorhizobium TaxID=325217 RepID=UPI00333CDCED
MKHQTLDQLQTIAKVEPLSTYPIMSRQQRIERWAELLEKVPERRLRALTRTEHLERKRRDASRCEGSPISVAFEDPVLRVEGLRDDSYGEAKRFFELTDWQLHDIVCSCHVGTTFRGEWAAARVRRTIGGNKFLKWLRGKMWH